MYEVYFEHFNKKVPLTEAEQSLIKSRLAVKKIRKKQYLLQEGDICKTIAFVEKGLLRSYTVDENGGEHIMQFAVEGWFISDLYSFLTGEPATYNIEAVEDSELVMISKSAYDELLTKCAKYEKFSRILITGAYIALQKRINSLMSFTLEERYETFMKQYPEIAQRVPQHMIASYIGLTPETLSRVRKRIATNK
ncbi:cyclic nucleotide-binding protein [Terrimonas sp.]|uniref:Crp/Fnr family transcriptional regulator n=1 Tax=Terrimonas sp. TaxID=1914338 RepID=UPI000D51AF96|nr:Crp/Fnr family transcriptional regulator [Terrimonas sp.]PVD53844.1 cyclic nucleotide-binding protein [Terrimonas sp.]